ncbi:MAG: DUF2480 family protein [Flavobacteriales bacterium]|nr:DUF2480 family protein [Flavobacteriales bacterium]
MEPIVNKVAQSGLITFNLENYFDPAKTAVFDLKDCLFMGLILREKDFREFIKSHDWSQYQGMNVAITCSADAIIPTWAYMLVASKLEGIAGFFLFGNEENLQQALYQNALSTINIEDYRDKKVIIKGCSNKPVPTYAYIEISRLLLPVVSSLMYGEPCSTVPVYKKKSLK